ncbi:hypothetical protein H4R20_003434 [Coemansia guatemalensis]|uniref:Protein kinase domain-containing protein n=1 Tax=Coemansia guatemalensis TaxID=2761395 RepID=A0A9W8HTB0_9FUNG|nr:hypothetical protein H4R20_003434 [Coemansia guatemalensis]
MEQADRDAKRDKEQADRDAKREEELKQWRMEQADRDARRDKEQVERDEKREKEQAERDAKLDNILRQILEGNQHNTQAAPTEEELRTPASQHRRLLDVASQSQNRLSQHQKKITSSFGTPQTATSQPATFNKDEYIQLSQNHSRISYEMGLLPVLGIIGNDWAEAWNAFTSDVSQSPENTVGEILEEYNTGCRDIQSRLASGKASEDNYQSAFGVLAEAIQKHAPTNEDNLPSLLWRDTHNIPIKRSNGGPRKPDGGFFTANRGGKLEWKDLAVAVEIKGDDMQNDHDHINGQLLQNFIDMADILPRRFMIGLTLASQGIIYVHVCVPSGIYKARLGRLPLTDNINLTENSTSASAHLAKGRKRAPALTSTSRIAAAGSIQWTDDEKRVVEFILFLYQQSCEDCGYLTGRNSDYPCTLSLDKVLGSTSDNKDKSLLLELISQQRDGGNQSVLGRHKHLSGQRTWVYPAQYGNNKKSAFFKFQWMYEGEDEIDVHQFVLKRKVPYVPEILCAASVNAGGHGQGAQKYKGEAIVMEDVGKPINSVFGKNPNAIPEANIIDIFAGYVHTLIYAALVDDDCKYALHRDVSMGNLMVRDNRHPYIIDWGCGRVFTENEQHVTSGRQLIGTTIYMGIRVLKKCRTRSVVDDLESLFLVLCHCLSYSLSPSNKHDDAFMKMWASRDFDEMANSRVVWLLSEASFLKQMKIPEQSCSALQKLVKGMYHLLFPPKFLQDCTEDLVDPREANFKPSEWLNAFEVARECTGVGRKNMPSLSKLENFANNWKGQRISYSTESPLKQSSKSPDYALQPPPSGSFRSSVDGSNQQTPTKSGSKRHSNNMSIHSTSKRPRTHD